MNKVDVIDFACGDGGSLGWAKTKFGWKTFMGVDIQQDNINRAISVGYNRFSFIRDNIVTMNIKRLPRCRYVIMHHFLEHLKSEEEVEIVINKAISVADEFVFIKHPFFDGDDFLESIGFRITWSHWGGHDCHVGKDMLIRIGDKTNLGYAVGYVNKIEDSTHDLIYPSSIQYGVLSYEKYMGEKQFVKFENIYHETYMFININCDYFEELITRDIS